MTLIDIQGFTGVNTAVNPRLTPERMASDMLNVRVENGQISPRYGYRNIVSAQTNFTAVYGLAYLQGYAAATEVEEYASFETLSGNTRAYSRHVTTGVATEITNGGVSVNLHASQWAAAIFDGIAYFINPSNTVPLYRHTIGTINSLTGVVFPADPTVAPSYTISYGPGGATGYTEMSWAGLDPTDAGEMACTGAATNTGSALNADNTVSIRHTDSEIESSIDIELSDITAGDQNWTYNDGFEFSLACETALFDIDKDSIKLELRNADGSPKTFTPAKTTVKRTSVTGAGRLYQITVEFLNKARADWDNVAQFKLYYRVSLASATVANNDMRLSKVVVKGVSIWPETALGNLTGTGGGKNIELAYSYYDSTLGFESGLSPVKVVEPPFGRHLHLEVTVTVSADAGVDNFRLYARIQGTTDWYRVATQVDSDLTYDYKTAYYELAGFAQYDPAPFATAISTANLTNAFPYKGAMFWLYQGGSQNVRISRIGDPLRQRAESDSPTDPNRGATFTLADNFGDEPLGGAQVGDSAMVAGKLGVYVMLGDRPAQMTPPRKVSGSFGVAGKGAFARWKLDNGVPCLAYVSPDGQVYAAIPGASTGTEAGDNVILSGDIRVGAKSLKTWLLDGQSALGLTDFSTVQVEVDERQDCLHVKMGQRGLKLRRPDIDGVRHWEPETYNTGGASVTIAYTAGSTKYGIRQIRSDGKFDEDEYNTSTRAFVTGASRDGGNAIASLYWESKTFVLSDSARTFYAKVDRETTTNTPTITDYSTNVPLGTAITIASGAHGGKFDFASYGANHRYRIAISENDDSYRRLELEMVAAGNRRTR